MSEPTGCTALCCHAAASYSDCCDLLVGLHGLYVVGVERDPGVRVSVESAPAVMGCPQRGLVAQTHLVVPRGAVSGGVFTEQDDVAQLRALLTTRACL